MLVCRVRLAGERISVAIMEEKKRKHKYLPSLLQHPYDVAAVSHVLQDKELREHMTQILLKRWPCWHIKHKHHSKNSEYYYPVLKIYQFIMLNVNRESIRFLSFPLSALLSVFSEWCLVTCIVIFWMKVWVHWALSDWLKGWATYLVSQANSGLLAAVSWLLKSIDSPSTFNMVDGWICRTAIKIPFVPWRMFDICVNSTTYWAKFAPYSLW